MSNHYSTPRVHDTLRTNRSPEGKLWEARAGIPTNRGERAPEQNRNAHRRASTKILTRLLISSCRTLRRLGRPTGRKVRAPRHPGGFTGSHTSLGSPGTFEALGQTGAAPFAMLTHEGPSTIWPGLRLAPLPPAEGLSGPLSSSVRCVSGWPLFSTPPPKEGRSPDSVPRATWKSGFLPSRLPLHPAYQKVAARRRGSG